MSSNTNTAAAEVNTQLIISFIETRADYNIASARLNNLERDLDAVEPEVKRLEEAVAKYPESHILFEALGEYAEKEEQLNDKHEEAWREVEDLGVVYSGIINKAQEAGLLKRIGKEWWEVELITQ